MTAGGKNIPPANIEMRFADDALFQHVVVYGDGRKFLVMGAWLNPLTVDAALANVPAEEKRAHLTKLVDARISKVNESLASYESIKRFAVMEPALTVEGGTLTPTLKVKRKAVYAAFKEHFEALYEAAK